MTTSSSYNSAVAAIWTPKRVVAACLNKITAIENVYFAIAGLSACADTGFDAAALVQDALEEGGSFKEKLAQVTQALEEPLQQAAQFVHDKQPDSFKKYLAGRDALDVILFTQRGDEVLLSRLAFKTKKRGKDVVFQSRQLDYPNAQSTIMSVEIIAAGAEASVAESFSKGTTGQQALVYPEKSVQKFIEMAIAADPPNARYPINIIKLAGGVPTQTTVDAPE